MTKPRNLTNLFVQAAATVKTPRDTHSLHVHNSTAAPAGRRGSTCAPKGKESYRGYGYRTYSSTVRQARWPGVGRLALGTWLVRAWVLTRVIVRVCEPCVPPLSLKRSPELFLPVPVRVRLGPRHLQRRIGLSCIPASQPSLHWLSRQLHALQLTARLPTRATSLTTTRGSVKSPYRAAFYKCV
jgi:hypothetical protein